MYSNRKVPKSLNERSEYLYSELNKKDLKANPIEQLEDWLAMAKEAGIRDCNAVSVATVSVDGQPTVRNVLLRQLDDKGLVFYTNRNSEKARHLSANNKAEMLFFWRKFNRQVRVRGKVIEVSRKQVDKYFQSRPLFSQQASAVSQQSQKIESRKLLSQNFDRFVRNNPKFVETPKDWTGFCLQPFYWEFWQGRAGRFHDRLCYEKKSDNNWSIFRLQP